MTYYFFIVSSLSVSLLHQSVSQGGMDGLEGPWNSNVGTASYNIYNRLGVLVVIVLRGGGLLLFFPSVAYLVIKYKKY